MTCWVKSSKAYRKLVVLNGSCSRSLGRDTVSNMCVHEQNTRVCYMRLCLDVVLYLNCNAMPAAAQLSVAFTV